MRVYSRETVLAIEDRVIGGSQQIAFELMKRAGTAAYNVMRQQFPNARRIQVLCGSGNNAGDGYVLAALAQAEAEVTGSHIEVLRVGRAPKPTETASKAHAMASQAGVPIFEYNNDPLHADVLVDALLGTGVKGAPRKEFAAAVTHMNAADGKVLALDLPSGMNPDTGTAINDMVRADVTVSFIGAKRGMLTGAGKAATGLLTVDRLGLSETDFQDCRGHTLKDWAHVKSELPRLNLNSHKHGLGHLLVLGGDHGMGGAAIMAAESALQAGTGLVTLATRPEHVSAALARRPELMTIDMGHTPFVRGHTTTRKEDTQRPRQGEGRTTKKGHTATPGHTTSPAKFDAVVVGPGLGRAEWGARLLEMATETGLPLLVDGDGLALLQDRPDQLSVITPHPGEAARLLGCETRQVNQNRFAAAEALANRFGAVTLLKGAGSLIAIPDASQTQIDICAEGNPGMATAGSGDVLSGIIGGFLAQGLSPISATRCGACLHAAAGDIAARDLGQRSLKATDILARLPELLRELD